MFCDSPTVPKSQLGDNLAPMDFCCKLEVWGSGWCSRREMEIELELCRQEQTPEHCLALLYPDDNGSPWGYIKVYLSVFAEHFGILEQGVLRLVINGLPHTGIWSQTECLEINLNILLIWNRVFALYMHVFLNVLEVINY